MNTEVDGNQTADSTARVLLVSPLAPYPPNKGGRQRTALLARALRACGQVDLLLMPPWSLPPADSVEHMEKQFGRVKIIEPKPRSTSGLFKVLRPLHPRTIDRLSYQLEPINRAYAVDPRADEWVAEQQRKGTYDLIVGRYLAPTARSGAFDHAPVIVDIDDLDTTVQRARLAAPGCDMLSRVLARRRLRDLESFLPSLLSRAAHLWLANSRDLHDVGDNNASVLPNIPYTPAGAQLPTPEPPAIDSKTILVVASMGLRANRDGVSYFVDRVWPHIRKSVCDAKLRLVGTDMNASMKQRWSAQPGVDAIGFAEDLRTEYRECAFTVVPVYEGAGTKIKVIESLAMGRSAVITPHALEGYESLLGHNESVVVAGSDMEFASSCVAMLGDRERRDRLAKCGATAVRSQLTFDAFESRVRDDVTRVLEGRTGLEGTLSQPGAVGE